MKITRKSLYCLNDCFDAEEKGVRVRISRHRHTVTVSIWTPECPSENVVFTEDGCLEQDEITLEELARRLRGK